MITGHYVSETGRGLTRLEDSSTVTTYIYCGDQRSKTGAARAVLLFNIHTSYYNTYFTCRENS
jgi:hypothetical protein